MPISSDERIRYLEEAFEALPEAIAIFDEDGRFVFWNACFAAYYGEEAELQVGLRFEDHVRRAVAQGLIPAARGCEEAWIADRMERFNAGSGVHDHQLGNGRWMRVQDRALASGGRVGIRSCVTDLREREKSLRLLYDGNPIPMFVFDRTTLDLLSVNDAAVTFYGHSRDTMLTLRLTDIRPETQPGEVAATLSRMDHMPFYSRSIVHRTAAGEERVVKVAARLFDYHGRAAVLAAVFDVTEQTRMEDEIRRTRVFFKQVVDHVPTAVFVKDMDDEGRYVVYNHAAQAMFGLSSEEALGRCAAELFDPDKVVQIADEDAAALRHGAFETPEDEILHHSDGSIRRIRTRKVAFDDGATARPRFVVGVAEDVTEQRASAARIAHMAHHDALTSLPNRVLFQDRLTAALARLSREQEGFALLYLDLDGFKAVNDVWGHAMGDALLHAVGVRLRAHLREGDTAARLGGDEFTLIQAPVRRPQDAERLAQRLIETLATPFAINGQVLRVGASIGIALAPAHGIEAQALLAHADAALYRAKREGRHTFRIAA